MNMVVDSAIYCYNNNFMKSIFTIRFKISNTFFNNIQ